MPDSESSAPRRLTAQLPWLLALFAATFWAVLRAMGPSPMVWQDTLLEEGIIHKCLSENLCTMLGAGATVRLFHSAGYFHVRSLLEAIGFTPNGTHLTLLAMNSLGVVLGAFAAWSLQGRVAAAIAAVAMLAFLGIPTQLNVTTDLAPMPFLGAVFLLLAVAATRTGTALAMILLGALGGVLANTYATGLLTAVSVLWIGLAQSERRWRLTLAGLLAFAVTTFLIAPGTWIVNARVLLSPVQVGNQEAIIQGSAWALRETRLAAAAVLVGLTLWVLRRPLGCALLPATAITAPLLAILLWEVRAGRLDPQPKYFAHVLAAAAVGLAVPLGAWVRLIPLRVIERAAPWGSAAFIALIPMMRYSPAEQLTYSELASVQRELSDRRGWSWARIVRNVKAMDANLLPWSLTWVSGWKETGSEGDTERAYLLKLPDVVIPHPLPAGIVATHTGRGWTTLLAFSCSWLDWSAFRICMSDPDQPETCNPMSLGAIPSAPPSRWGVLPGMPDFGRTGPQLRRLTLHLPLHPSESCPVDLVQLPHSVLLCGGHVQGSPPGEQRTTFDISQIRKGPPPGELALEWHLDEAGCWSQMHGGPPFFIDGSPDVVAPLVEMIDRRNALPPEAP